jgi:hypothetical protein
MWHQAMIYMLQRFFGFFDYEIKGKRKMTCSNCGESGHMRTLKQCPNYRHPGINTIIPGDLNALLDLIIKQQLSKIENEESDVQ